MKHRLTPIKNRILLRTVSVYTHLPLLVMLTAILMMQASMKAEVRGVLSLSASKNRTGTRGHIFPGHAEAAVTDMVTAAPNIIALIIETDYITGLYDTADAADYLKQKQLWTVHGLQPENVSLAVRPFDEFRSPLHLDAYFMKQQLTAGRW